MRSVLALICNVVATLLILVLLISAAPVVFAITFVEALRHEVSERARIKRQFTEKLVVSGIRGRCPAGLCCESLVGQTPADCPNWDTCFRSVLW